MSGRQLFFHPHDGKKVGETSFPSSTAGAARSGAASAHGELYFPASRFRDILERLPVIAEIFIEGRKNYLACPSCNPSQRPWLGLSAESDRAATDSSPEDCEASQRQSGWKIAVLAPIPSARVRMATVVNPGFFRRCVGRSECPVGLVPHTMSRRRAVLDRQRLIAESPHRAVTCLFLATSLFGPASPPHSGWMRISSASSADQSARGSGGSGFASKAS